MILKKIQLNNFLSHSETILEIEDDQKFLLDGKSGAGKSSIIDSLIWALYGRGRSDNRSLIKKGKKYAKVIVTMKDNNDTEYNVIRSVTNTGKHDLSVTRKTATDKGFSPVEASGIKDIQDYIEKQILHSSYLLFLNSIIYPQDNVDSFVRQTAARRKEIILEIVNASDYDEYYSKTKDKIKELEIKLELDLVNIKGKEEVIEEIGDIETSIKDSEIMLSGAKADKRRLSKELEKESELFQSYSLMVSEEGKKDRELINTSKRTIELKREVEKLTETQKKYDTTDLKIEEANLTKEKVKLAELETLKSHLADWSSKMLELVKEAPIDKDYDNLEKRINEQIISLMKKDVEICPEIGKSCPIIVKEKDAKIKELSDTLDEIVGEKNEYIIKRTVYNKNIKGLGEQPRIVHGDEIRKVEGSIFSKEEILNEIKANSSSIASTILSKENEIKLSKSQEIKILIEIGKLIEKTKGLSESENKVKELKNTINELDNTTIDLSALLSMDKTNKKIVDKTKIELKLLQGKTKDSKKDIESLKILKEAFSNNGIKAIVIDYVIPRLEDKINTILSQLSDFRVRLDTQRKGVNDDRTKEGLFIDIINESGEILSFESYSGGEKMKINMAIFEALASLSHIDFRVFDETFLALDQESSESFLEVIKEIRKNVRQFVCISHMQNIKDFFQDKVNIVKINGDSSIG